MSTAVLEQITGENGGWGAGSYARFWEPGVEEWARKKLHLPEGAHVDAAMLDKLRIPHQRFSGWDHHGNQVVNGGLDQLWNQAINGVKAWAPTSTTGFTGIAVGNATSGADAKADTDLAGASKAYRVCDNTYPKRYGATHPVTSVALTQGQALFACTFLSGEANFDWNEYGILIPTSSSAAVSTATAAATTKASFGGGTYVLLNHKLPAGLGTKSNGAPATLYVLITVA